MASKVILSADSTCDIGPELQSRYDVQFFNYHIQIGDESFIDRIEVSPAQLYAAWRERGILPKTAAITPAEYAEYFRKWVADGYEVVHVNLGSALSSAYQNCMLAAGELGHVYPVDSYSLSSGSGHLVVQAGEMVADGFSAAEIQEKIIAMRHRVRASFILDTLEFMAAGGRCSSVAAFGANLLKLKPCIAVDQNDAGRMSVGKKYRGTLEKALAEYVRDQLDGRGDLAGERIFITHSGAPAETLAMVAKEIPKYAEFREIVTTQASGTISSHCGPSTVGILYMVKE